MENNNTINGFDGDYAFLSNFYPCTVTWKGRTYQNSESAYQSAKLINEADRDMFLNLTGAQAKKLSRNIEVREYFNDIKKQIMYDICKCKFFQNSELGELLLNTGDATLIEGNYWGDRYWGQCGGYGQNNLGKILMQIREELKELQYSLF